MYYILEDKTVKPIEDVLTWAKFVENGPRRVNKTKLPDGKWVSTIFIGVDLGFNGKPQTFETMVFERDGMESLDCERYSTWGEAQEGHEGMVAKWT